LARRRQMLSEQVEKIFYRILFGTTKRKHCQWWDFYQYGTQQSNYVQLNSNDIELT